MTVSPSVAMKATSLMTRPRSNSGPLVSKGGDIEKERQLEERMRELGLLEHKKSLEQHIAEKLERCIEQHDALSLALKQCRRRRPLKHRVQSAANEIRNLIRSQVLRSSSGQKVAYCVDVLMGCFTSEVDHRVVDDRLLELFGATPTLSDGPRLSKEISLQFPDGLDMERLSVRYGAGVFRVSIPYTGAAMSEQSLGSDAEVRSIGSSSRNSDSPSRSSDSRLSESQWSDTQSVNSDLFIASF